MKKLGFRYKVSSKLGIPLDGISFVAQRAYFLRIINDLRRDCAKKQIEIVKNILLGDCLLVHMYQGHRDIVIRVNGVFIK